jgi:hypothetical protein
MHFSPFGKIAGVTALPEFAPRDEVVVDTLDFAWTRFACGAGNGKGKTGELHRQPFDQGGLSRA